MTEETKIELAEEDVDMMIDAFAMRNATKQVIKEFAEAQRDLMKESRISESKAWEKLANKYNLDLSKHKYTINVRGRFVTEEEVRGDGE